MAKILVVDDVRTDREILGKIVTRLGHTPLYAADGAQALATAREAAPDLILLDVVMPEEDGRKVCETLKSDPRTARIPVVLVTSKGGGSPEADDQVTKPNTREAIEAVICRHVHADAGDRVAR